VNSGTLGGQAEYPKLAPGEPLPKEPRLFECSNATGSFKVNEIADFTQSDLNDEDVYLLDTFTTVYLWIGSQANATEKSKASEFAQKYIVEANDGRDTECSVVTVKSAEEPVMFSSCFVAWDPQAAANNKFVDPYQAKLDKLNAEKAAKEGAAPAAAAKTTTAAPAASGAKAATAAPAAAAARPAASASAAVSTGSHSWDDVKAGTVPGMDLTMKENYLDAATFQAKLGCSKAEWDKMPKWKKDAKKKELGIF